MRSHDSSSSESECPNHGKRLWKLVRQHVTFGKRIARIDDKARLLRKPSDLFAEVDFSDKQLTRISLRLDGMDSYSVLGALIAGFSLQLVSSVNMTDFDGHRFPLFPSAFVLFGTLTTVSALYATIIFALCSLHGKAGIGMNNDDGYLAYITKTARYRESAFVALISCFVGVAATLGCMLLMRIPPVTACLSCAVAAGLLWLAAHHVKEIMRLASQHIYS